MKAEWILSSCFLILAVLVLRWTLGRRMGTGLRYALWLAVLVRLLVPVQLFTSTVVGMRVPALPSLSAETQNQVLPLPEDTAPPSYIPAISGEGTLSPDVAVTVDTDTAAWTPVQLRPSPEAVLSVIWTLGTGVVLAVLLGSNLLFYVNLRRRRRRLELDCPLAVYVSEGLPSPCLFGLPRPAVYVTPETAADPAMLRHVLAHELTHARHLDHLWNALRCAALAVHWWNPLVWLAAALSRRDGELACDEGALKRLGDGERRTYGETLLALAAAPRQPRDLLSCATTMSGGKRDLQERIRLIARRQKRLVGAAVATVALLALVALCAFGRWEEAAEDTGEDWNTQTEQQDDQRWRDAEMTVDGDGVPYIRYGADEEWVQLGGPIAPPAEWAHQDMGGRDRMTALPGDIMEIRAKLVSPTEGWLVACIGHGVANADTYVYKTSDGGVTWTETPKPGEGVHRWYVGTVGYLSSERLIIAWRLHDAAPCFITKDGGETWDPIALPEEPVQVQSIDVNGQLVTMAVGHEGMETRYTMISRDLGDTWEVTEYSKQQPLDVAADLDHDGAPEELTRRVYRDRQELTVRQDGQVLWSGAAWEGGNGNDGWDSWFLCRLDGRDYLLELDPYYDDGWDAAGDFTYRVFSLEGGQENVLAQGGVQFDLDFLSEYTQSHRFEPREIAAFVEEVNGYLAGSTMLISTDLYLEAAFAAAGEQRFTMAAVCGFSGYAWDSGRTELENLLAFRNFIITQNAAPPLIEVFSRIETEDLTSVTAQEELDRETLVRALGAASSDPALPGDAYLPDSGNTTLAFTYTRSGYSGRSYAGEQRVVLEAGERENMVRVTLSGQITTILYSENPGDDATYLHDLPYSFQTYLEDAALYALVRDYGLR